MEDSFIEIKRIKNIQNTNKWLNVRGRVIQIWDNNNDSISQSGLLGDETGQSKFVSWKKSSLPLLERNKSYLIKNVVVDFWNNNPQLNLNKASEILPLNEEIEVNSSDLELTGIVRDIVPESGLIMRCPSCKRVLVDDVCMVHGEVEAISDLRVKASFETKDSSYIIVLNRSITEDLIGITLAEAEGLGKSEIDKIIKDRLLGSRFIVKGSKPSKYFLVSRIKPAEVKQDAFY